MSQSVNVVLQLTGFDKLGKNCLNVNTKILLYGSCLIANPCFDMCMCIDKLFFSKTYYIQQHVRVILITNVLSFTNSLSRSSLYFSLKTSFIYSNLFSLAKTVTIRCYIQTSKRVRSPSSVCKKARATA